MRENRMGLLIKKISEHIEKQVNFEVKKYNLTMTQVRVIVFLFRKEGRVATQKEIELFMEVAHPTIVSIISSLEKKGFVRCCFDENDHRMKNVYLIWGGNVEIYQEMRQTMFSISDQLVQDFTEDEKKAFARFLESAYTNSKK